MWPGAGGPWLPMLWAPPEGRHRESGDGASSTEVRASPCRGPDLVPGPGDPAKHDLVFHMSRELVGAPGRRQGLPGGGMETCRGCSVELELITVAAQSPPREGSGLPAGGWRQGRDGPGDIWTARRPAVAHGAAGDCLRGKRNTFSYFLSLKSHDVLIIVRRGKKSWFLSSSSSLLSPTQLLNVVPLLVLFLLLVLPLLQRLTQKQVSALCTHMHVIGHASLLISSMNGASWAVGCGSASLVPTLQVPGASSPVVTPRSDCRRGRVPPGRQIRPRGRPGVRFMAGTGPVLPSAVP